MEQSRRTVVRSPAARAKRIKQGRGRIAMVVYIMALSAVRTRVSSKHHDISTPSHFCEMTWIDQPEAGMHGETAQAF